MVGFIERTMDRAMILRALLIAAVFSTTAFAQQAPLPQPFNDPSRPGDRIMQLQIPGGATGPVPIDQLGRMPMPAAGSLAAVATFEPGVISMHRIGEYQVTIVGAN